MSRTILIILCLFPLAVFSQPPTLTGLLDVPFLTSGTPPVSRSTTITRFDKRIIIVNPEGTRGSSYTNLYLNTRNGDMGIVVSRDPGDDSLRVNDETFRLLLITQSGEAFSFMNQKKQGRIEKLVVSGGTEVVPITFAPENGVLDRQTETRTYRRRTYTLRAYRAGGDGATTFFLYGNGTPDRLVVEKSLSYSGIGYLKTDRGIFMILETSQSDGNRYFASGWRNVNIEFDKAPFRVVENELVAAADDDFQRKMQKLESEEFSGPCQQYKRSLNEMRKRDLRRRNEALNRSQSGNVYQGQSAQSGYSDLFDFSLQLESLDMETQLSICETEDRISRAGSTSGADSLAARVRCKRSYLLEINRIKLQADAVDERYRTEPGRAFAEKQRLMAQLIGQSCR